MKPILVLLPLLIITCFSYGQWNYFSAMSQDMVTSAGEVIECTDGGYVYCSTLYLNNSAKEDVLVEKLDDNGNLIWSKTYGLGVNKFETASHLFETSDGGFLVFANSKSGVISGLEVTWFLKLNALGDTLWTKKYWPNQEGFRTFHIEAIGNDQFVGVGSVPDSVFFTKFDATANVIGYQASRVDSLQTIQDITLTPTGEFTLGGGISYYEGFSLKKDFMFLKLDATGNVIWKTTFGPWPTNMAFGTAVGTDGNYMFTGYTRDTITEGFYTAAIKLDALTGDTLWLKNVGTWYSSQGTDIESDGASGFVISGYVWDLAGNSHPLMTHIDANGNINWHQVYSNETTAVLGFAFEVKRTTSGYVMFATGFNQNNERSHWIINTDTEGNVVPLVLEEIPVEPTKELIGIVDPMGRNVEPNANEIQIYIFSDGSIERCYKVMPE